MAESIAVHFKKARWDELGQVLDSIALRSEAHASCAFSQWLYPKSSEPGVFAYAYDDMLDGYEDEDLDRIFKFLDDFPSAILCIQLRSSQGNRSCDCATELALILLKQFEGVADDGSSCWTLKEIVEEVRKNTGRFLDCYRRT